MAGRDGTEIGISLQPCRLSPAHCTGSPLFYEDRRPKRAQGVGLERNDEPVEFRLGLMRRMKHLIFGVIPTGYLRLLVVIPSISSVIVVVPAPAAVNSQGPLIRNCRLFRCFEGEIRGERDAVRKSARAIDINVTCGQA